MASVSWTAGSGNWSNPANWDLGRLPDSGDDVTIAAGGLVVTLDVAAVVNTLTLDSPAAFGVVTTELDVANPLVANGRLDLGAATLNFVSGGTLDGSTLALTSRFHTTFPGGPIPIPEPAPSVITSAATLTFGAGETVNDLSDQATIDGTGTVLNDGEILLPDGTIAVFPFDSTINSLDIAATAFTNNGTISVGANDVLDIGPPTGSSSTTVFSNAGAITIADGAKVNSQPGTQFTNPGTITLANGGSLVAWLATDLAHLAEATANIVNNGGSVTLGLNGTLDNTGSVFDLAKANAAGIGGFAGLLDGGTIAPNGGLILFAGGTLNGVTYLGPMDVAAGSTLDIENGLTVTAPGVGPGLIDLTGTNSAPGFGAFGSSLLRVLDTETLDNLTIIAGSIETAATLTFGPHLLVDAPAYMTMTASDPTGAIVNHGTILLEDNSAPYSHQQIAAPALTNTGSISIGENVLLNVVVPDFSNTGTITIHAAATMALALHATLAEIPARVGNIVNSGGSVDLRLIGTIENTGTVFDAAAANALQVTGFGGNVNYQNTQPATLHGGTLIADDGALVFNNTTLDGVTVQGEVTFDHGDVLFIRNGFSFLGTDSKGAGSIVMNTTSGLVITDNETVDDATIRVAANASGIISASDSMTLGAQLQMLVDPAATLVLGSYGWTTNTGTVTAAPGGASVDISSLSTSAAFLNNGLIALGEGDYLSDFAPFGGTGQIVARGGDYLRFSGYVAAGQTLDLLGTGNILSLDAPAFFGATISGFVPGDTIHVNDPTISFAAYDSGKLSLYGASGLYATLNVADDLSAAEFNFDQSFFSTDITIACFAAGTRIRTPHGDTPVELLRVGEHVDAVLNGPTAPVVWIGRRVVDCIRHPRPDAVWPVRIAANAFGSGMPERDLLLSPDHALFLDRTLIPLKYLINGTSIAQLPMKQVTYYHVELQRHDVLLADGLPVESYLDTADRANFANGGGTVALYPDFASRVWEVQGCAPLVVTGPQVDAVRAQLNALAGVAMTQQNDDTAATAKRIDRDSFARGR